MQLLSCKAGSASQQHPQAGGKGESQTWSRDLGAKQLEGEEEEERKRRKEQGKATMGKLYSCPQTSVPAMPSTRHYLCTRFSSPFRKTIK